MTESEYYELPYGVADRQELERFLIADHHYLAGKLERKEHIDPKSTKEIILQGCYQLFMDKK